MKEMTKENLQAAFAGESQAHMKYLAFSAQAEKDGLKNVSRLFEAIAYAEQVHATNHARELGYIGSTSDNLEAAMGGEGFEVDEMYPAYKAVAELQEEKGALKSINFALAAEKIHRGMYQNAKGTVASGKDIEIGAVYICPVCGFTYEGNDVPAKCPVCGVDSSKFVVFE